MDHDYDQAGQAHDVLTAGDAEAYRSLKITVKVPQAFDGHVQSQQMAALQMKNQLTSGSQSQP